MAAPDRAEDLWKQRNDPNHSHYWILNGADHRRYFNAGVFRFVYKGWVTNNRSAMLLDCLKKIQNHELSVNHGDQDILNYVVNGYLEILETTFNSQIFAASLVSLYNLMASQVVIVLNLIRCSLIISIFVFLTCFAGMVFLTCIFFPL
jgi:lipopolysaccharide biosynthesis glycosyltransferase